VANSNSMYSDWSVEQLRDAIFEAESRLASSAEAVSSPDGTSVRFRPSPDIEINLEKMRLALAAALDPRPRRRVNRLNFMHYGRWRRWMR